MRERERDTLACVAEKNKKSCSDCLHGFELRKYAPWNIQCVLCAAPVWGNWKPFFENGDV